MQELWIELVRYDGNRYLVPSCVRHCNVGNTDTPAAMPNGCTCVQILSAHQTQKINRKADRRTARIRTDCVIRPESTTCRDVD